MAGTNTLFLLNGGSLLPKGAGLEAVLDVDKTVAFLGSLGGRDKLCRVVQYFAKWLATFAADGPVLGMTGAELGGLASALSMARKGFRLFKSLDMYKAVRDATDVADPVLRIAATLRALGYGVYLMYDNWVFLVKSGFAADPALKAKVARAYKFWTLGLVCSMIAGLYKLSAAVAAYNAATRAISVSNPDNAVLAAKATKAEAAIRKVGLGLAKDVCDAPIPLNALGWGGPLSPSLRFASFTGTLSSAIGFYLAWPADGGKAKS
ncbi:peroxin-11 [Thecamonas trahens ATCC 50062]|uniref:Peroxin-11 n=1 Tax=Thecamonas trahens ATCC 50062 TaxID=461836 RepID=A0A0L0DBH2_THETB|nr:peroxin-11 [Thecamonas trahens ATCC 50062]KNC48643.1 peroxin-11 [Thecamonas trahens ATCC 50062]|eukprot:XP_013762699.1 peroxin-11 [Thecamonas trahens ATCC 50062]